MIPYLIIAWVLAFVLGTFLILVVWDDHDCESRGWKARRTLAIIAAALGAPASIPLALLCLLGWLVAQACRE